MELKKLIDEAQHKKESVSSQLSREEKILQNDIDWLDTFGDQLTAIEGN